MDLRNRTALVTGGAVRIGAAICAALAAEGCNVAIHCRNSGKAAEELAERLRRVGVKAEVLSRDLSTEEVCMRLVAEAVDRMGGLDILINSAAVFHKDTLMTSSREKLISEWTVNLMAPLSLMRAFASRAVGQGKIVNLLDRRIAGHDTACLPYLLSKKALEEVTLAAALELAPRITVNAVAPGAVLPPPGKGDEYMRDGAGHMPLGVKVSPDDVAAAVVFLLKSDAITGQVVFVDGGQHLLGNGV